MYNAGKLRLIQYANGENRVSNLFATAIGGTDFACGQVSTTTA